MNEVNGTNKEFDAVGFIMEFEGELLTDEQIIVGFQGLIDNGMVWTLQGSYGRMATKLIDCGYCHAKIVLPVWLKELIELHESTTTNECGCNPDEMSHCIAGSYLNGAITLEEIIADSTEAITRTSDGIKVEGHRGKWYVIDEVIFEGKSFFLLEHETYGEDADHIAIDASGYNIFSHITDGTDEILERLIEREEESDEMKEQRAWFTEVSYRKAIELFEEGVVEVYCLYDDGSEGLVEEVERIEGHCGRFGIE